MVWKHVLIVIPTFNERENIAALCKDVLQNGPEFDVLVVDDGSPDGTAAAVEEVQQALPGRVFLIVRQGKGGRGSAVLDGFRWGLRRSGRPYDAFMEMDADYSHQPSEIPGLLSTLERAHFVVGSRYLEGSVIRGWGFRRTVFSWLANRFARFVLGIPIRDYTNGFRAYRRMAVEGLEFGRIKAKGYVVLSEVAYQLWRRRLDVGEVPTLFINRRRGTSNFSLKEIKEAFWSVLRIRFGAHRR